MDGKRDDRVFLIVIVVAGPISSIGVLILVLQPKLLILWVEIKLEIKLLLLIVGKLFVNRSRSFLRFGNIAPGGVDIAICSPLNIIIFFYLNSPHFQLVNRIIFKLDGAL